MSTPRRLIPSSRTGAAVSATATAKPRTGSNDNSERASPPPQVNSDTLFGLSDVVLIQHAGETYRLQRTRLGKLILTK